MASIMSRLALALVLSLTVACAAGPTEPTPEPSSTTVTTAPQPAPEPAPAPVPEPVPPAPVPAPQPAPAPPAPAPVPPPADTAVVLHGTVDSAHWLPSAAWKLPDHFDMTIRGEMVTVADLTPERVLAMNPNGDFVMNVRDYGRLEVFQGRTRFQFMGGVGSAQGSLR